MINIALSGSDVPKGKWFKNYCSHFASVTVQGIKLAELPELLKIVSRLDSINPPEALKAKFTLERVDSLIGLGRLFSSKHGQSHSISLDVRYNPKGPNGPEIVFMHWVGFKDGRTAEEIFGGGGGAAVVLSGDIQRFITKKLPSR